MSARILVNVGCGPIHHPDWSNLDIITSPGVSYHNIKKPLPFKDGTVDVVYHSHVLEHLTQEEGASFVKDCYRVLKPGGILRIAVPDLEQICREYLSNLEDAISSNSTVAIQNYRWSLLELFDQMIRTESGGEINKAIVSGHINKMYVLSRTGEESAPLFDNAGLKNHGFFHAMKRRMKLFVGSRYNPQKNGEAHKWMYDRLSLSLLLEQAGFKDFEICHFDTSRIPDWEYYALDASPAGTGPRKPDSLFVEAIR